jgi:hypothetical protein
MAAHRKSERRRQGEGIEQAALFLNPGGISSALWTRLTPIAIQSSIAL